MEVWKPEGEGVDETIVAIKKKLGRIKEEVGRERRKEGVKGGGGMKSVKKRKRRQD